MEDGMHAEDRERASIVAAWKDMPRSHRAMLYLVFIYYLSAVIVLVVAWATHKSFLNVGLICFGMLSMLAISVWHAVVVKGGKAAIAFFVICIIVSWLAEYAGHSKGWFFGHYHYTDTLGPAIGGVPIIITITWSMVVYSAFMLVDWLLGIKGGIKAHSWWGKTMWAALIASCTATLVCAWDLIVDPVATSGVWWTAAGKDPWWYWLHGGPYLRELPGKEGLGMPGVPIGNFVGWWLAPFFMILVFMLFFQKADRVSGSLVNAVPFLVYLYISFSIIFVALQMNWHFDGMNQVSLIGFFTLMPVILVSTVKLAFDYT